MSKHDHRRSHACLSPAGVLDGAASDAEPCADSAPLHGGGDSPPPEPKVGRAPPHRGLGGVSAVVRTQHHRAVMRIPRHRGSVVGAADSAGPRDQRECPESALPQVGPVVPIRDHRKERTIGVSAGQPGGADSAPPWTSISRASASTTSSSSTVSASTPWSTSDSIAASARASRRSGSVSSG